MSPDEALRAWQLPGPALPCADAGLINRTYLAGRPPGGVLQWVNPIFSPEVNRDIALWAERLESQGIAGPQVVPTAEGQLWLDDDPGCWRMLSYIPGRTIHRVDSPRIAGEAGSLVGRVHRALDGWLPPRFAPVRRIHDTPARMAELESALLSCEAHPLEAPARELGAALLSAWARWDGPLEQPDRICHGDLKISNLRFDERGEKALCLLDLDTVGPMDLCSELGDAWRSWCNPAGEDDPERVRFDIEIFEASARAFLEAGPRLEEPEIIGLVPAIERICIELGARFCADSVRNTYFREDLVRFPIPGAHNLHRARCQLALAEQARQMRSRCEAIVLSAS